MTSTVLDVTVLLLCVSAGVVALGASDAGGPDGPSASDAADRLVTETATVAYADADAPNGTRRIHATRAELLALVVERDGEGAFGRRAIEAIQTGLGPRTRVDATVGSSGETTEEESVDPARDDGAREPTGTGTEARAAFPAFRTRDGSRPEWVENASSPRPIAADAVPEWATGERGPRDEAADLRNSVAVGPEPPRDAAVTVAVVKQPTSASVGDDGDRPSGSTVRIVVRRW